MHGDAKPLFKFLNCPSDRFIIPVYQRNYDWSTKQCEQLFDDLLQIIKFNRKSHFFGSIVSTHPKNSSKSDFFIIDGQQRITTISIFYIVIVNLLRHGIVKCGNSLLADKIEKTFLIDEFSTDNRKLRLKPVNEDCESFDKLFLGDEDDFVENSNITKNYRYFYDRIIKENVSVESLCDAISRLEIIDIFVDEGENPQLIFESLNSTGLALTEADKIRNFILMGLDSDVQKNFYENYWNKIEKLTSYNVSDFIRHYLTLIQKRIPNINSVYVTFKDYVMKNFQGDVVQSYGNILKDMLRYAKIYHKIKSANNTGNGIDCIIARLNVIDVSVAYPFLFALFAHLEDKEITEDMVKNSLLCIESFIFRRIMCLGYPTNSLNKIFCMLDTDVLKMKGDTDSYDSVLIYILEHKVGNAGFPSDAEFEQALQTRDIYHMQKKNKEYLFDRLENTDSVERVEVIKLMESQKLTIEHIMPQTLSDAWKKSLGANWKEIYDTKLHTLQNLTLTGYNSNYQNKLFTEKKNCDKGFRESGLNLNKPLLSYDVWTETEMANRFEILKKTAFSLWPYPKTSFIPKVLMSDEVTLEDADDLTGRKLISFSYGNSDIHKTKQWVDMFTSVVQQLLSEDYSPMFRLANSDNFGDIRFSQKSLNSDWFKLSNDLYLYKATSTASKLHVLNRLFEEYGKDKSELVFQLEPISSE